MWSQLSLTQLLILRRLSKCWNWKSWLFFTWHWLLSLLAYPVGWKWICEPPRSKSGSKSKKSADACNEWTTFQFSLMNWSGLCVYWKRNQSAVAVITSSSLVVRPFLSLQSSYGWMGISHPLSVLFISGPPKFPTGGIHLLCPSPTPNPLSWPLILIALSNQPRSSPGHPSIVSTRWNIYLKGNFLLTNDRGNPGRPLILLPSN